MKNYRFPFVVGVLVLFGMVTAASGAEITRSHRFVRAIAMGDAFTAVADSSETIAYNPAGLLQENVEWSLSFPLLGFGLNEIVKDWNNASTKYDFSDTSTLQDLEGKRIFFSTGVPLVPSLFVPNKGIYAGIDTDAWLEIAFPASLIVPKIDINAGSQAVVEYAMAFDIWGVNVGANLKAIYRVGIDKKLDLLSIASDLQNDDVDKIISDYAEDQPGLNFVMDFGLLYRFDHPWQPRIGIAALDVVSVDIEKGETKWGGINFRDAGEVKQLNSIGFAMTRTIDEFDFTGSLDFHDYTFNYFPDNSYTRRISLGFEAGYDKRSDNSKLASFQFGLRELKYPSFGMTYTLGILKFATVRWVENFGTAEREFLDTRYMFLLSFLI